MLPTRAGWNVDHFLELLKSLYKEGLQHRTINTIRSAVSTTHDHIKGVQIGKYNH